MAMNGIEVHNNVLKKITLTNKKRIWDGNNSKPIYSVEDFI
jgi:hypothetical protein